MNPVSMGKSQILYPIRSFYISLKTPNNIFVAFSNLIPTIGHFTVVYLVAKPFIWSEAEGDLVVIETSI